MTLNQLEELVRPIVNEYNAFLLEVIVRGDHNQKSLEIFVDTDTGITTGECSEISRALSPVLDASNFFQGRYHLVVSSPGIDRPLKFSRQYRRSIGKTLTLQVTKVQEKIIGILEEVHESGIVMNVFQEGRKNFVFTEIVEARVDAPW